MKIRKGTFIKFRGETYGMARVGILDTKTFTETVYIYGFIDEKGKIAIEPKYQLALDFTEGLAPVGFGEPVNDFYAENTYCEGKWGYIDKTGKWAIEPIYDDACCFSEGLASIGFDPTKVDPGIEWYNLYQDNRQNVDLPEDQPVIIHMEDLIGWRYDYHGFINKEGEMVIDPIYKLVEDFKEGYTVVCGNYINQQFFIDKSGCRVFEDDYYNAHGFSEDLACIEINENPQTGPDCFKFINRKGEIGLDLQEKFALGSLLRVDSFHEELACFAWKKVTNKRFEGEYDIRYGFLDMEGNTVVEPEFFHAGYFSEGLASAKTTDSMKWGYINRTGEFDIEPQFDKVYEFRNGIARVEIHNPFIEMKMGYIDKNGEYIWEPTQMVKNPLADLPAHYASSMR